MQKPPAKKAKVSTEDEGDASQLEKPTPMETDVDNIPESIDRSVQFSESAKGSDEDEDTVPIPKTPHPEHSDGERRRKHYAFAEHGEKRLTLELKLAEQQSDGAKVVGFGRNTFFTGLFKFSIVLSKACCKKASILLGL